MNVTVNRDSLNRALRIVTPVATPGTSLSVLGGVHLSAIGDMLSLSCFNGDLNVTTGISATCDGSPIVVPAILLAKVVAAMSDETVTLEADETTVRFSSGDAGAELFLLNVEEWPKFADVDAEPVTLDASTCRRLGLAVVMCSADTNRGVIQAVHFSGDKAQATDSYRAAIVQLPVEVPECLVPADTLTLVLKNVDGELGLAVGEKAAKFTAGVTSWTARTMEGEYPKITNLVPDKPPFSLRFAAAPMLAALGRVGLLNEEGTAVKLAPDGGKALLSITREDVGSITDVVSAEADFDFPIGFNARYFASLIELMEEDEIALAITDAWKPTCVRNGYAIGLVMPVRIG